MRCDQCHEREAVVHLTQVENDQVSTVHLCERCAAERGVEAPPAAPSTLGSFLAAMGKGLPVASLPDGGPARCAGCGATLQDFRETGRLGCAECYTSFEGQLRDLLRRLHGSTHHMGERYVAPGTGGEPEPAPDLRLREELRQAIEAENFELAAELRDRLRGAG